MATKRFYEIDNLYAIGTLLVIFGHSHSSDWSRFDTTPLKHIILFIYTFHMPLFFIIAGFLFSNSNGLEKNGYIKWLADKAIKLLTPYVVVSMLSAVPKYYFEHHSFNGMALSMVKGLFAPRLGVWGHFWFLPVLFLVYVIFGACKAIVKEVRIGGVAILVLVSGIIYFLPYGTEWLGIDDLKNSLLFFSIGMFVYELRLNDVKASTTNSIVVIIAGLATSIVLYRFCYEIKIVMLLSGLIMLLVCCLVAKLIGENATASWLSRNNFTIYIYSWPFQSIAMVICDKLTLPWFVMMVVMFGVGLFAPIVMITIYREFKFINNRFFDLVLGVK